MFFVMLYFIVYRRGLMQNALASTTQPGKITRKPASELQKRVSELSRSAH